MIHKLTWRDRWAFARLAARGFPPIRGGNDAWAEFCPRVVQCVVAAGFLPGGPAPGSQNVPAGYTGPLVVYAKNSAGPLQLGWAGSAASAVLPQAAEQQSGDLLIFAMEYDTGTPALASSPGTSGTQIDSAAFSNGKLQLWSLPYNAGDGAPTFTNVGNNIFNVIGFVLRKAGGTPALDQHHLANADAGANFFADNQQLTPAVAQSFYLGYAAMFGAASAAARNQVLLATPQQAWSATVPAISVPDSWLYFPIFFGQNQAGPMVLFGCYRVDKPAKSPALIYPYFGTNGGAGNTAEGQANWN